MLLVIVLGPASNNGLARLIPLFYSIYSWVKMMGAGETPWDDPPPTPFLELRDEVFIE
jgi:hypothetical protein